MTTVIEPYKVELQSDNDSYDVIWTIIANFDLETDSQYGADADGRRGVSRTEAKLRNFSIHSIGGNDITEMVEAVYPDEYIHIKERAWAMGERAAA